jgi:alkyl hydroperoxide reductase subunit AhpC
MSFVRQSLVQQVAPNFTAKAVHNGEIVEISLSQFKGKYVILLFYPLDFTFVCPTELCAFSDAAGKFKELNCEVLGISVDSEYSHLAWSQKPRKEGGLSPCNIALVADLDKSIASQYGVLVKGGVALRGLFIIDPNGVVRQSTINDLPFGRSVEEALRLVQAIQFVEKHGEVCPANWKPGQKTMKADPKGSQEYFGKL